MLRVGDGGGGGGEEFNHRSEEARPTRCRVEPARVSSPQVDLTRCGLDKTPTLLVLQSRGKPPPQRGEGIRRGRAPLPGEEGLRRQRLATFSFPARGRRKVTVPKWCYRQPPPPVGEDRARCPWRCPKQRKNTEDLNPHAVTERPSVTPSAQPAQPVHNYARL